MEDLPYTDDELKKVLKTLMAVRKQDIEEMSSGKTSQKKFLSKLMGLKPSSDSDSEEAQKLKGQLERVRPAFKKLTDDLKQAHEEIERLKQTASAPSVIEQKLEELLEKEENEKITLQERLKETLEMVALLQHEKQSFEHQAQDILHLKEQHTESVERFRQEKTMVENALRDKELELEKRSGLDEQVVRRFEEERLQLVEKLAESLGQLQKQTETIQDLQEEVKGVRREAEEQGERRQNAEEQLGAVHRQKEELLLRVQWAQEELNHERQTVAASQKRLEKNEWVIDQEELEERLKQQEADLAHSHEELVSRYYGKMRDLSARHANLLEEKLRIEKLLEETLQKMGKAQAESAILKGATHLLKKQCRERDAEIRKAQQHLAKKIKECTLLQDLLERQKIQAGELQKAIGQRQSTIEHLQAQLHLQKAQEENYLMIQQEYHVLKVEHAELQKIQQEHEKLSSQMVSLKHFFSKMSGMVDENPPEGFFDT